VSPEGTIFSAGDNFAGPDGPNEYIARTKKLA
jgi:hypothetical protein